MSVLNDICLNIVDCEHKTAPTVKEGIPSIRTTDIKHGVINFTSANKVSEKTYKKWTQRLEPQPHDLILAREAPVGEVGIIPIGQKACLGQRTVLIRPNPEKVFPHYLLYLLLSPEIQHEMKIRASGSTVEHLNMSDIRELELPTLPSLNIQKRIGRTLANLDDKIENLRKQNETLEKIAQTLFKHWFIDFEFPNENGQPYRSSGGAMQPSELGAIPAGWRVGKLGDYCTIFRGSSPRPISSPVFFKNGTLPWIKIADATRAASIYISETREFCTEAALPFTRFLKKGSLILSNSATVGIPMILNLDGCIHDGWLSFSNYQKITRNFLYFVLISKLKFLILYADGTVQKNLNTGILREMNFVLASSSLIE